MRSIKLLFLFILLAFPMLGFAQQQAFFSIQSVEIHPAGSTADDPPEKARLVLRGQVYLSDTIYPDGLTISQRFLEGGAQLNVFSTPQVLSVSLQFLGIARDMVLVDESGIITEVLSAAPYDVAPLTSAGLVKSVLQLNAGEAKTYGIVPGERIIRREVKPKAPDA